MTDRIDPWDGIVRRVTQEPLNRKLRQYASVLSYNDKAPIPAIKHLLLEAAMKIESLDKP